jgi:alpha-glucosidase
MNNWKNLIDSGVSSLYVKPLYPKKNANVTISVRITDNVKNVHLFVRINGTYSNMDCFINREENKAYCTIDTLQNDYIYYYFAIKENEEYYYYGKKGLNQALVSERDMFCIKTDIKPPTWVSGSTCYQIFPDRFCNGDKSIDPVDSQYKFDGGIVKKMDFNTPPLEFDEGRCLDFYGGDLQGIINSIDYFKRLSVNCLYLNPIGVSRTTHRYDCADFFHIDEKLGGDEMFIKMVDELHKADIKVIIDISINHTGTDHPWFIKAKEDKNSKEASYYYIGENGEVACWEGVPTLPQLNYTNEELRGLIYKNEDSVLRKFLKDPFNQDGWRLDVAEVVGRRGNDQLTEEIWKEVHDSIKSEREDAYLVGEAWNDAVEYLQGDMWDAQMNYVGCGRAIRRWLGEKDRFLLENWGSNPGKTLAYDALALKDHIKGYLDTQLSQMAFFQMNLFDSHDTPRLHNNSEVYNEELYKGGVMLSYMLPGMPSTYYGDEIGLDGTVNSVEMWRYPMQWNEEKWNKSVFETYCELGKFRAENIDVLSDSAWCFLNCDENHMSFARYNDNKALILIMNKAEGEFEIDLKHLVANKSSVEIGSGEVQLQSGKLNCKLEKNKSIIVKVEI